MYNLPDTQSICACKICGRSGDFHTIYAPTSISQCQNLVICDECYKAVRLKPSPSQMGRSFDQDAAPTTLEWITALSRSWSITKDCFRCELTTVRLDLKSATAERPFGICCIPGPSESVRFIVVAGIARAMRKHRRTPENYRNLAKLAQVVDVGWRDPVLADQLRDALAGYEGPKWA
jgi:hypothetical protein